MFQYTKATLRAALLDWNTNSNAEYVAALDDIIQRGELRLSRLLDLDNLDGVLTTTTAGTVPEVFKPANLVNERVLVLDPGAAANVQLQKRSRAWIEAMNATGAQGVPRYYGEFDTADEDSARWFVAPIPDAAYLIFVHGNFSPASIVDGSDGTVTWFSRRVPDLLFLACSVEANEYLKYWAKKAANEAELAEKAAAFLGVAANLTRADTEDLLGQRQKQNAAPTQAQG